VTQAHPNVLLLTVDALRADRVGFLGYHRPTTPNLQALAKQAIVCGQTVSMAAFTQPSFHSFLTSSRPLSYGGYDSGGLGRPGSVFRAFQDAGYETVSLSTFPWVSRYFGYDGLDTEYDLFVLNTLVGIHGSGTMASALRAWHGGEMSVDEAVAATEPFIIKMFDDLEDYSSRKLRDESDIRHAFANSPVSLQGYDFARVLKVIARHRRAFLGDKRTYLEKNLTYVPRAHEWLAKDWRLCRTPGKLVGEAAFRMGNRALALIRPELAKLRSNRIKRYVDGADLADGVVRAIRARAAPDRPFFLWTHFVDCHLPYCAGPGRNWYRHTADYLEKLGYSRELDLSTALVDRPRTKEEWDTWSALYDATVRYVDEQIGRIVDSLDQMGIRDDTMIVVCGDHGEELGEHGDITHHFRLYDHNLRVPLLLHRPGTPERRIDAPTTLLDLAPSVAEMAGIEGNPDWEGESVTAPSVAQRDHVVVETFHGGGCLFDRRPLYIAVRTGSWKYMWKEYVDPTDRFSPDGPELFDLRADPTEQTNLFRADHPMVASFNFLIAKRLSEIPEFGPERIDAAFGTAWRQMAVPA
jgi:arylsulfatase A-like enzyme